MSAYSLADEAVARLHSIRPQVATAQATGATPAQPAAATIDNALGALINYIPTESIAIYLAVVSAFPALTADADFKWITPCLVYSVFCLLTPVLFLLVFYNRLITKKELFPKFWQIPWWRTVASIVAFAAWGLAVPGNPLFGKDSAAGAAAGLIAILVSVLLGLVTPIIERVFPPPA